MAWKIRRMEMSRPPSPLNTHREREGGITYTHAKGTDESKMNQRVGRGGGGVSCRLHGVVWGGDRTTFPSTTTNSMVKEDSISATQDSFI